MRINLFEFDFIYRINKELSRVIGMFNLIFLFCQLVTVVVFFINGKIFSYADNFFDVQSKLALYIIGSWAIGAVVDIVSGGFKRDTQ